jgi:hypothetical protein
MLNQSSQKRAIAVATVAAIFMMAGLARADDGGSEDYMIPAAFVSGETEGGTATCAGLLEDAWFQRELARTDGDASPEVPAVSCRPDIYAESTVDAD